MMTYTLGRSVVYFFFLNIVKNIEDMGLVNILLLKLSLFILTKLSQGFGTCYVNKKSWT